MKNFIFAVFVLMCSLDFANAEEPNKQPENFSCMSIEQATSISKDSKYAQQVLCCCPTRRGGQCCNYQPVCIRLVEGCICSSGATQATPVDSDAQEGKFTS